MVHGKRELPRRRRPTRQLKEKATTFFLAVLASIVANLITHWLLG